MWKEQLYLSIVSRAEHEIYFSFFRSSVVLSSPRGDVIQDKTSSLETYPISSHLILGARQSYHIDRTKPAANLIPSHLIIAIAIVASHHPTIHHISVPDQRVNKPTFDPINKSSKSISFAATSSHFSISVRPFRRFANANMSILFPMQFFSQLCQVIFSRPSPSTPLGSAEQEEVGETIRRKRLPQCKSHFMQTKACLQYRPCRVVYPMPVFLK